MIIRRLNSNEMYKSAFTDSIAFDGSLDYDREKAECLNAAPNHSSNCHIIWAAVDDDGTVAAKTGTVPYDVRFDGHIVKMGGIGGVASLPTYRRSGLIRECMRAALSEMNDEGYVLSSLYPFSRVYYRKFGYENFADICEWTVDFKALSVYPGVGGKVKLLMPEDDLSPLDIIYREAFANVNHATVRDKYRPELAGAQRIKNGRCIYVWYDDSDKPRGFISFKNGGDVIDCRSGWPGNDFVFCGVEAFKALLNFASTMFVPRYHAIRFKLPDDVKLNIIINEMNHVGCESSPNGMTRVVNVQRALKLCRCKGEGQLSIGVRDGFCPWNDGVYRLGFKPDSENNVVKDDTATAPDITMDIRSFTTLICGINRPDDIPFMPDVIINNSSAPLENVFYKKINLLTDCF